ncbi:MAG: DUF1800 family protein [Planctomycetes bacterium]|nr:DUF1800 family protein [Planctomycetota bacterium]MCB9918634.1 DUF1800 family protein [Planctomycetota bacterium]
MTRKHACLALGLAFAGPLAPSVAQVADLEEKHHVLSRISFGVSPTVFNNIVTTQDLDNYILKQMHMIGNVSQGSVTTALLGHFPAVTNCGAIPVGQVSPGPWTEPMMQWQQLVRMITSEDQLVEVMTYFWENHFSTSVKRSGQPGGSGQGQCMRMRNELIENEGFRKNCLGTFYELAKHSLYSPAMRFYLNLAYSCDNPCRGINEDFFREWLELHLLDTTQFGTGVPNYTNDTDIQAGAAYLAGLWVNRPNGNDAAYNQVTSFTAPTCTMPPPTTCNVFPATTLFAGPAQAHIDDFVVPALPNNQWTAANLDRRADALLRHILKQTQSKTFLCSKLLRYFIADDAPESHPQLMRDCIAAWGDVGDIKATLKTIFFSPEFRRPFHRWRRIKLPVETAVSQARALGGQFQGVSNVGDIGQRLAAIDGFLSASGATLYQFPSPDGFPFASQRQIGMASYWQQGYVAYRVYEDMSPTPPPPGTNLTYKPKPLVAAELNRLGFSWGTSTAGQVALATLQLFFRNRYSTQDLQVATAFLDEDSATGMLGTPWNPNGPDADARLRLVVALCLSLPQFCER